MNKLTIFDYMRISIAVIALAKGIRNAIADGKLTKEEIMRDIVGGALAVAKTVDPSLPVEQVLTMVQGNTDMMMSVVASTDQLDSLGKVK